MTLQEVYQQCIDNDHARAVFAPYRDVIGCMLGRALELDAVGDAAGANIVRTYALELEHHAVVTIQGIVGVPVSAESRAAAPRLTRPCPVCDALLVEDDGPCPCDVFESPHRHIGCNASGHEPIRWCVIEKPSSLSPSDREKVGELMRRGEKPMPPRAPAPPVRFRDKDRRYSLEARDIVICIDETGMQGLDHGAAYEVVRRECNGRVRARRLECPGDEPYPEVDAEADRFRSTLAPTDGRTAK